MLRAAAVRHHAVPRRRQHAAHHAQHPRAARRRRCRTAPLHRGGHRWQCAAARRGRARTDRGRTSGHAGIHRRRHPGHRSAGPHPRLQPPLRDDLGHPRRPAQGAAGRRRARLDAAQRGRARGLPAPAAGHPGRDAAQHHRTLDAAFGPGARARDTPAVVPRPGDGPGLFVPRPERAAGRAAAHRGAVDHRHADRPAQPPPSGRACGAGQPALAPGRHALCAAADRPGPLPPHQRQPGPRNRRPRADRRGPAHQVLHAQRRPAGTHRRRPVRTAGRRCRHRRGRSQRAAHPGRGGRTLQPGRRAVHVDLQHRRGAVPGPRPQRRRTGAPCRSRGAGGQGGRTRQLPRAQGSARR